MIITSNGSTYYIFFKMVVREWEKRTGEFAIQDKVLDIHIM